MKSTYVCVSILLVLCLFSCSALLNPEEDFDDTDAPVELTCSDVTFSSPWGYYKSSNSFRYYPMLVSGKWGEGQSNYKAVAEDYPAFVLDYQYNTEDAGAALALWITEAVEAGYRINTNRIYLTGFSAGGSGSYPLAKGMYTEDMFFAAIIRVAGQSQADLTNEIAEKTAVWYHIGLSDTKTRVEIAQQALEYMRGYDCNSNTSEYELIDEINGYPRTTVTLIRKSLAMFKYSEYTGMGHTSGPCYSDEELFPWLFSHSLSFH